MKQQNYKLVKTAGGFQFVPEKGIPTEIFNDKITGLLILISELDQDKISYTLAKKLLNEVKSKRELHWANYKKLGKKAFKNLPSMIIPALLQMNKIEKLVDVGAQFESKRKPALVVCPCGTHGNIVINKEYEMTAVIRSKKFGRQLITELFKRKEITKTGKLKLEKELASSKLPEEAPNFSVLTKILLGRTVMPENI